MHMIDVMKKLQEIAEAGYDNEDIQRGIDAVLSDGLILGLKYTTTFTRRSGSSNSSARNKGDSTPGFAGIKIAGTYFGRLTLGGGAQLPYLSVSRV